MTSTSLSKRGYSSKTCRAVVFGPRRLLGIGDRHLYYEQGVGATLQLLKHIRAASKLGTFLQIGLDWTQLHPGVFFSTFEKTSRSLPHLDKGWFPATRTFLGSIDARIHFPTTVLSRLLRANDCILMDNLRSLAASTLASTSQPPFCPDFFAPTTASSWTTYSAMTSSPAPSKRSTSVASFSKWRASPKYATQRETVSWTQVTQVMGEGNERPMTRTLPSCWSSDPLEQPNDTLVSTESVTS
jgi:hypothetical protein